MILVHIHTAKSPQNGIVCSNNRFSWNIRQTNATASSPLSIHLFIFSGLALDKKRLSVSHCSSVSTIHVDPFLQDFNWSGCKVHTISHEKLHSHIRLVVRRGRKTGTIVVHFARFRRIRHIREAIRDRGLTVILLRREHTKA